VVFLDIVGYSQKVVAEQSAIKDRLNTSIASAIEHVMPTDRIILDTGDGAALCFLSDPEDALFAALSLRDAPIMRASSSGSGIDIRIGVNVGPVRVVRDINDQRNVLGDGINVAQRVMSFAQPNQVLVSRSFYEIISRVSQEYSQLFHYYGLHKDKHLREHEVYAVMLQGHEPAPLPEDNKTGDAIIVMEPAPPALRAEPAAAAWDAEVLASAEQALARYIGPLAKLLVRRAARLTLALDTLYAMLADAIPTAQEREQFLKIVRPVPLQGRSPDALIASSPTSQSEAEPMQWEPAALQEAARHLAHYLGPMAAVWVRREAPQATSRHDLYQRLARHLADAQERQQFLKTAPRG
jgi:hypothetical protein